MRRRILEGRTLINHQNRSRALLNRDVSCLKRFRIETSQFLNHEASKYGKVPFFSDVASDPSVKNALPELVAFPFSLISGQHDMAAKGTTHTAKVTIKNIFERSV